MLKCTALTGDSVYSVDAGSASLNFGGGTIRIGAIEFLAPDAMIILAVS